MMSRTMTSYQTNNHQAHDSHPLWSLDEAVSQVEGRHLRHVPEMLAMLEATSCRLLAVFQVRLQVGHPHLQWSERQR